MLPLHLHAFALHENYERDVLASVPSEADIEPFAPWVLKGYVLDGLAAAHSAASPAFTRSHVRLHCLRFLRDARTVWAPVMSALTMAHPSLAADHEKHLTDLSTERLVRLVQAQHQQLCLAAQLVFSVYQQYTRFAKRPPFMCSFRSIRKSIIKDIFRQPPGLELSPDDCRYGLVPLPSSRPSTCVSGFATVPTPTPTLCHAH